MARKRLLASSPAEAVETAIARELAKRPDSLKPIEIVKSAIAAYQAFVFAKEPDLDALDTARESQDAADLRRGTQAAVDRLLFNANYWRSAYERRIMEACTVPEDAQHCLQALSVWTTHALRLNTLSPEETAATFERFCPPFALNNRRGAKTAQNGSGKGPLPDLARALDDISGHEPPASMDRLHQICKTMEVEAAIYEELGREGSLVALFTMLPAWCLQNRIELVSGSWWDDPDVMDILVDALHARFLELGFGEAVCRYFSDSCYEALDAYHRDLVAEPDPLSSREIPELMGLVQQAREQHPDFETDGYGATLPHWLISKEQLIWNTLACSIYGPASTRPLLVDSPALLADGGYAGKTDVITELARTSFSRYATDRTASQAELVFPTFSSLPTDLRDSSIAYISSIPAKLETLGYEVLPQGSCYPERRVTAFTPSEVECLAILEHRRWLKEREGAGWRFGEAKDVEERTSPYLVPWEELPERAREWNRSAVRSIPSLLASVNLAVVR